MPLFGKLSSMSLPDLLQWLSNGAKTGTLEVERDKVVKHIVFRGGCVIACSSDEPSEMLGHVLVSRGTLSEEMLREALAQHAISRKHLGEVVIEMGLLGREELSAILAAKAEETIFSLFDWEDAVFRFYDDLLPKKPIFPVSLRVEEILLRGAHRRDEIKRIRTVFNDPGIVLARTGLRPPDEVFRNRVASRIYEMIDGERTVADILLHSHASEYLVNKFLLELFRSGYIETAESPRPADAPSRAEDVPDLLPPEPPQAAAPPAGWATPPSPPPEAPAPAAAAAAVAEAPAAAWGDTELQLARGLMGRGEFDAALELLNAVYRARPTEESIRRLVAEAEAAFVEKAYRHYVPGSRIPTLVRPLETLTDEQITPAESFLLSRIDGTWDVRSIVQITPIREVDALRTLKRMREKGLIELRDPD